MTHVKKHFMTEKAFFKIRLYVTGIVTLAIWSLLLWNYFHGGIPKHHILADETLPEISNLWGGALLPLLTWFLMYRVQKRIFIKADDVEAAKSFALAVYGFVGALVFSSALSVCFTLGYSGIPGYMMLSLLGLAFFFPIYRSECLLGFVIGMTFTFGAVLPTGIGSILALVGAVFYLLVRPAIIFIASRLMPIGK
jgi:hypothetical protein